MDLYNRICASNREKYGTEFEKILKIIINQYSDRTHFIYEVLQNAEDAGATYIRFRLERERFIVFHNGRPFNVDDIEGVCGIASGTKEDGTRIGHFGIGFKSIYCYTSVPSIYSGKYRFRIVNQLFPEALDDGFRVESDETCIVIPFDKKDVSPQEAFGEIKDALTKRINAESIIILDNIKEISIDIEGSKERKQLSRAKYLVEPKNTDRVFSLSLSTTITNLVTGKSKEIDNDYLFFTDDGEHKCAVVFKVDDKELVPVKNSRVYAFFPTAIETHQNFYIHAPFDTTPARDNLLRG